jgi:hypothetical protein
MLASSKRWSEGPNDNAPELLVALRKHARAHDVDMDVGDGWLPLVRECHEAVLAQFPDYELLAVKQKYGELAFQAWPRRWSGPGSWTDDDHARIDDIVESFRERSAEVCERCGAHGRVRTLDRMLLTLCEGCFEAARKRSRRWKPWSRTPEA